MKRIPLILLALGLVCLAGQFSGDYADPDTGALEPGTMVMLTFGACATVLGCAHLVRRRT